MERGTWFGTVAMAVLLAGPAGAETTVSVSTGATFGADSVQERTSYGAALTVGGRWLAVEGDIGSVPGFFDGATFTSNHVTTAMLGVLVGPRWGRGRVYAAASGGMLLARVRDSERRFDVDIRDFGLALGGGAMARLRDKLSARADVRYLYDTVAPRTDNVFDLRYGRFTFWRATVGLGWQF